MRLRVSPVGVLLLSLLLLVALAQGKRWNTNKDSIIVDAHYAEEEDEHHPHRDVPVEKVECLTDDGQPGECVTMIRCHPILFSEKGEVRNAGLAITYSQTSLDTCTRQNSIDVDLLDRLRTGQNSSSELGNRVVCCAKDKIQDSQRSDMELEMYTTTLDTVQDAPESSTYVPSVTSQDVVDVVVARTTSFPYLDDEVVVDTGSSIGETPASVVDVEVVEESTTVRSFYHLHNNNNNDNQEIPATSEIPVPLPESEPLPEVGEPAEPEVEPTVSVPADSQPSGNLTVEDAQILKGEAEESFFDSVSTVPPTSSRPEIAQGLVEDVTVKPEPAFQPVVFTTLQPEVSTIQPLNAHVESDVAPQEPEAPTSEPIAEPEAPVAEPEVPVAEPEIPAAEPEIPAAEPEIPVAEAEAPVAEPEVPVAEPEIPAAEPEVPTVEVNGTEPEPEVPASESEVPVISSHVLPTLPSEGTPSTEPQPVSPSSEISVPPVQVTSVPSSAPSTASSPVVSSSPTPVPSSSSSAPEVISASDVDGGTASEPEITPELEDVLQQKPPTQACPSTASYRTWPVFYDYPWLATIQTRAKTGPTCSGSLITETHVLTAAHCLHRFNSRDVARMQIRLGFTKRGQNDTFNDYVVERKATKIIFHKRFHEQSKMDNNIALIKLDQPVEFNDHIAPIGVFNGLKGFDAGNCSAIEAGWIKFGNRKVTGISGGVIHFVEPPVSNFHLRESLSRVYNTEECAEQLNSQVNKNMLCAKSKLFEEPNVATDFFRWNDGGPLVIQTENMIQQIGIKSWAYEGQQYPTVYTRVDSYLDWIRDNLRM